MYTVLQCVKLQQPALVQQRQFRLTLHAIIWVAEQVGYQSCA